MLDFGIEYYSHLEDFIVDKYAQGQVGHVQLTIPNERVTFEKIQHFFNKNPLPLILHSNFLNTFGENQFDELDQIALVIQRLRPRFVIEHFTLLRRDKQKFAVCSVKEESLALMIQNLIHWQHLISYPLLIENTPITEESILYYQTLISVAENCHIGVALDIPHFLISLYSLSEKSDREKLLSLVTQSDQIKHVHLGGLKVSMSSKSNVENINHHPTLEDQHHGSFEISWNFFQIYFRHLSCTWEQTVAFTPATIHSSILNATANQECRPALIGIDLDLNFKTLSILETNQKLCKNIPENELKDFSVEKYMPLVDFPIQHHSRGVEGFLLLALQLGNFCSWLGKKRILLKVYLQDKLIAKHCLSTRKEISPLLDDDTGNIIKTFQANQLLYKILFTEYSEISSTAIE